VFVIVLAVSIKSIPFALILMLVSSMIVTDFFQSTKEGLKLDRDRKRWPALYVHFDTCGHLVKSISAGDVWL